MQLQKQFLESNGWTCTNCQSCSGNKINCINSKYKGYVITLHKNGIARINLHGRIIVATKLYNLEVKMKEEKLLKPVTI